MKLQYKLPILLLLIVATLSSCKIQREEINENDVKGTLYLPLEGQSSKAMLIFAGGAHGDYWGNVLAQRDCSVLSVSYYGFEGLPPNRENIPLEYFENILTWLSEKTGVPANKIIIMGASGEAELALQIAAHFPKLSGGVIAIAPGAVSWSNTVLPQNSDEVMPSWTFKGKPIPYIPMPKLQQPDSGTSIVTMPYWEKGLSDSIAVKNAMIKAESINGPILLISGKDDQVWPAPKMANMVEDYLKEKNFKHKVQNIQYENSGHLICSKSGTYTPYNYVTLKGKEYMFNFGGTRKGNIAAQKKALQNIMDFVNEL